MVARGEIEPAIVLLNQLRAQQPDNADAPYLLAMIYFDNRRWPDGLAAAQMAVRKNPALKADPDLIKGAIRSLVSDRGYDRSQSVPAWPGPAGDAVHQGGRRPRPEPEGARTRLRAAGQQRARVGQPTLLLGQRVSPLTVAGAAAGCANATAGM